MEENKDKFCKKIIVQPNETRAQPNETRAEFKEKTVTIRVVKGSDIQKEISREKIREKSKEKNILFNNLYIIQGKKFDNPENKVRGGE